MAQLVDAVKLPIIDVEAMVPIPLYHSRQRERGNNQAEILAMAISKKLNIPVNSQLVKQSQWRFT